MPLRRRRSNVVLTLAVGLILRAASAVTEHDEQPATASACGSDKPDLPAALRQQRVVECRNARWDQDLGGSDSGNLGLGNFSLTEWTRRLLAEKWPQQPDEARRRFMEEKLAIDLAVVDEISVPNALPAWPGAAPQVAFLFMAYDGLDFEEVWDQFFSAAPMGRYSIYIHRAAAPAPAPSTAGLRGGSGGGASDEATLALARWGAIAVPRVETGWCALMGGQVAMLSAALQDARNQQFVFVSHNTVPLKSFAYIYWQLAQVSPATSKFCFAEPAQHRLSATEMIRNELRRQCIFRDFYRALNPRTPKHHQWLVLAREHAQSIIRNARAGLLAWSEVWKETAPDVAGMGEGCSDESVPATALLHDIQQEGRSTGNTWADLARMGVEQQCLTYVLWRHCYHGTDLDLKEPVAKELQTLVENADIRMLTDKDFNFYKSTLKQELNGYPAVFDSLKMEYLWKLVNSGFMFARKFAKGAPVQADGASLSLEQVLPVLWNGVDEEAASQAVWSRLEAAGVPRPI